MTPDLKNAIQGVINAYFKPAKKEYNQHAFNKKPKDHVYKDLLFLREQVKVNRRNFRPALYCAGEHEIHSMLLIMMDLKETLDLDQNQIDWTNDLNDEITVLCLHKPPKGEAQRNIAADPLREKISITEAKRMILARMRNMILTQNI